MVGFRIIVACTQRRGIGYQNKLPWGNVLKEDLQHFKELTTSTSNATCSNVVIMGRKTWESLPSSMRPLPNRINIVISRTMSAPAAPRDAKQVHVFHTLSDALSWCETQQTNCMVEKVYVIGGGQLYAEAIKHPSCQGIDMTSVVLGDGQQFPCDVFFPKVDEIQFILRDIGNVQLSEESNGALSFQYLTYDVHPNWEEQQYLNLAKRILEEGVVKGDRTGTGTKSLFGAQMRFSLRDGKIPLLSTKKLAFRLICEELFWMIAGKTDSKLLAAKGVHIWDDNGSREFLDKLGFTTRDVGDLGPVYGFQWRHSGAEYKDCYTDYTGQGIDQLQNVINKIQNNPNDRRIIISAWNVADIPKITLPPCHFTFQFCVENGELSCMMTMRSSDVFLGLPFNIASYSLLTIMIAHICKLVPKELIINTGDTHLYLNHLTQVKEQLQRTPRSFPTIRIKRQVTNIEDFQFEDFQLQNYNPYSTIKAKMAV